MRSRPAKKKFKLHLHMCSGMESVWLVEYYKMGWGRGTDGEIRIVIDIYRYRSR